MSENRIIIEQFNKGAQNFDSWSVTQDERMIRGLSDFCGLSKEDHMLDVACGTGAFSLFSAGMVESVTGVDISEGMISIARKNAKKRSVENISFYCQDVESIELEDHLFSIVVSKSAFHHMKNYQKVFSGMVNYCQDGGRICIQDIMAYDNDKLDSFFEQMELLIDASHYKTYSKREFFNLYKENSIKLASVFESESKLDFYDYVGHVVQSDLSCNKIKELLEKGLKDPEIASCFVEEDGRLLWKRKVCTIIGHKDKKNIIGS
ncbi:methyltransferase domain-containing protein [Paenibacillus sp. HN-1]|uniref:class I SAM-dependent methyltransferase n=1 Tax=Paenibacillus TaxID=44249 RepID=UPI001CA94244|nr:MULTISPECIES: class I SAM-dependent methyltransferase [Paenibacillus]MBY9081329.1 methyltransferase domain-containing protein [Paenibacillus sp. CGMCC 1.18879]MBY9086486.1 methyltransferase domain-containing protein [Paenibacillus sinensis]